MTIHKSQILGSIQMHKQMWDSHTMEYYSAVKKELTTETFNNMDKIKIIMVSERSQPQRPCSVQ